MPPRDAIHDIVKQAIIKDGWNITADPYVISYGERFLFVDLGASKHNKINNLQGGFIGAERDNSRIAIEIKDFKNKSVIGDLEQAIGQYVLYSLLLNQVDPGREVYLATTNIIYEEIFREEIGQLVINNLPLKLIIVDINKAEIKQWIPPLIIAK
ncbi:XisH family protein [Nostoc sp. MS1]|uniref:XisH family protein n=1 Tax=Nostoc sp. MS1 TaxID=2764711 RepID=UPI001CC53A06|nr:XisH family protein [Nostoc sp. MS1]BCL37804.1 hypothetical protein NSMS1_42510 [Nostoc sp. MS1]